MRTHPHPEVRRAPWPERDAIVTAWDPAEVELCSLRRDVGETLSRLAQKMKTSPLARVVSLPLAQASAWAEQVVSWEGAEAPGKDR